MSSAWRSLSLKRSISAALGSSAARMMRDHLVDVEQHQLPALEDVDAIRHLAEPMPRAPLDRGLAEADPLDAASGAGPSASACRRAPTIVRLIGAELSRLVCASSVVDAVRPAVDACGSWARTPGAPPHPCSIRRAPRRAPRARSAFSCSCSLRERLLAGLDLRVGQLLDFLEHLLRARARRQLGDHQLPLAARQVLDLPARAHLERAAAGRVGGADLVGAADDLAAAGIVGPRQQRRTARRRASLSSLDQRHRGGRDLAQVVARHLGGQADRDAAGAVEQHERQARRQQRAAPRSSRRSWARSRPCLRRSRRAAGARSAPGAPRCSASPRRRRRRGCRSCPGRRSADSAARSPAPCAPARRTPPGRRADGSARARRRRRARSSPALAPPAAGEARPMRAIE